ncbi:sodium:proton antiporter [Mycobacterium intermedium]|nr:MnhB domain-containing protein [Mycobacterium intermedium]MCV6967441.1 sodium:proton antiporter [Mycobacterium intermedium]
MRRDVVLRVVARVLLGPSLMVAAALIVKGYVDVGDGFAAGMVVALAVALSYVALGAAQAEERLPLLRFAPHAAVGGLLISLVVGFAPLIFEKPLFSHFPGPGQRVVTIGSLELFTPLIFDIGVFLLVFGVMTMLLHQFGDPEDPVRRPADDVDEGGEAR